MRYLWDKIRENYYGVFKRERFSWTTKDILSFNRSSCLGECKNIDIDTKDINVRGNNPSQYGIAKITRNLVRDWMEKNCFGEQINKT